MLRVFLLEIKISKGALDSIFVLTINYSVFQNSFIVEVVENG